MFPGGWPGAGLLLLRLVAGAFVISDGIIGLTGPFSWTHVVRHSVGIAAGILLIVGLWTPIAGALVAVLELWSAFSGPEYLRSSVVLASLGAALAMLGPGVRSIDARLFGRKLIAVRDP